MIYLAIAIAIILQCQNYSSCGSVRRCGIAIGRRMLRRPGQWPLAMADPPAAGLGNGCSLLDIW